MVSVMQSQVITKKLNSWSNLSTIETFSTFPIKIRQHKRYWLIIHMLCIFCRDVLEKNSLLTFMSNFLPYLRLIHSSLEFCTKIGEMLQTAMECDPNDYIFQGMDVTIVGKG